MRAVRLANPKASLFQHLAESAGRTLARLFFGVALTVSICFITASALILWIQPLRDAVNWARAVEETETHLELDQIHRDQIRAAAGGTELTRRQHRLRMQTQLAQQMQEAEQQERSAPRRQSVIDALSRGTFVLPPAPDPPVPEATSPIDPSVPEDCAICLLAITAGSIVVTLRCEHTFHAECVTRWAARRATCPICRSRITTRVCALHGTDVEIGGETNQEFRRVEGEAAPADDAPEVLATLLRWLPRWVDWLVSASQGDASPNTVAAQRTLQATVAVERWVRSPLYAGGESDSADSEEEQDPASASGDEDDSSS